MPQEDDLKKRLATAHETVDALTRDNLNLLSQLDRIEQTRLDAAVRYAKQQAETRKHIATLVAKTDRLQAAYDDGEEGYAWLQSNLPTRYLGKNVVNSAADWLRSLLSENAHLLTSREGWAARSKEQFDRIGVALDAVREKRPSGEPARDDATEVEALVVEVARLLGEKRGIKE